ncbi:phosphatase 2C-like domain-containing protein [Mycena maculata]|uniref:Phosphatase 2C-like domain-containing protein n=1 Tax=Mycena maculata TaxID=230809 RepID=A0AAD7HYE4_9AGAR|nr:phosphatase 2C-like domain-containing protein [Mycena maculata]
MDGPFTTENHKFGEIKIFQSVLPAKNEDRTVVFQFKHNTMIAIFDGHYSDELSNFASEHLPTLVANNFDPNDPEVDIEQKISKIFEDFDQALLSEVTGLFKDFKDKKWSEWSDSSEVHDVIGRGPKDSQFRAGRRAVVGTTVLIGIIDNNKKHIWVVSLGDSDAVCGRMKKGKLTPVMMSERHNCTNTQETLKLAGEHPGEKDLVIHNRVLGVLAVTRALGDHQMKVQERALATKILAYFYPGPVPSACWAEWDAVGNVTPPYLSACPVVRRHDLLKGDILVFASDGLRDSMNRISTAEGIWDSIPAADQWDVIMSLANGEEHQRLGHDCITPEHTKDGDNSASLLIKNVLWGQDAEKKARKLADPYRDDISVVIVDLGWNSAA